MYLNRLSDLASKLQDSAFSTFNIAFSARDLLPFGKYWITDHTVISNITSGVFTLNGKMLLKSGTFPMICDSFVVEIIG